ncbi:DNA replication complex GINS protein PSF1-like [Symsagittifera roscoffensis]|uniref:DNA replication complex GINS protein PSF1-like n=1 Tax=Symsagittifera roscoffensis TaxID=84072 RepID=UPI00307B419F
MTQLCGKATELIKELKRSENNDNIPAYNENLAKEILTETEWWYETNRRDVSRMYNEDEGNRGLFAGIQLRHTCLSRNKRCLLAYHYQRLRKIQSMRWNLGIALPTEARYNLSESEKKFFTDYSRILSEYMESIGDQVNEGSFGGCVVDLQRDTKPPKQLLVRVRCVEDIDANDSDNAAAAGLIGRQWERGDGCVNVLGTKGTELLVPLAEAEPLIKMGVLEVCPD